MATAKGDHDRVVMASLKADGTPDQTADYTFIGDKEFSKAAAVEQRKQQLVSAADVEMRGKLGLSGSSAGDSKPDPQVQKLIDAHESAAKEAESAAGEVDSRFEEAPRAETRRDDTPENTAGTPAAERAARR